MSSLFYMLALLSVIYGQDSLYRLNAIIASVFVVIALQQLLMPKVMEKKEKVQETQADRDVLEKIRKLREDMIASELDPTRGKAVLPDFSEMENILKN